MHTLAAARRASLRIATLLCFSFVAASVVLAAGDPTVRIGKESKPAVAILKSLVAGDVACYATVVTESGVESEELADFELCEQTALLGKRVRLEYALEKVLADECAGNPDCGKSKTVALIVKATPLDPKPSAPRPKIAAGQASFCTPRETVVFACRTGKKMVSACASADASPTHGYLQYRFGKPDSTEPLEMTTPEGELRPNQAATGSSVPFAGGGGAWLRFRSGDHAYVLYTGIGKWGPKGETREKQGIVVERAGRAIANLTCTAPPISELGPDWFERVGIVAQDEDFDFPE